MRRPDIYVILTNLFSFLMRMFFIRYTSENYRHDMTSQVPQLSSSFYPELVYKRLLPL